MAVYWVGGVPKQFSSLRVDRVLTKEERSGGIVARIAFDNVRQVGLTAAEARLLAADLNLAAEEDR